MGVFAGVRRVLAHEPPAFEHVAQNLDLRGPIHGIVEDEDGCEATMKSGQRGGRVGWERFTGEHERQEKSVRT